MSDDICPSGVASDDCLVCNDPDNDHEIDELRCQVAALEIKLHAAREALAACREAAQKRAGR